MSTALRRTFAAKYDGSCGTCPATIAPGDHVFYAPGNELVSGLDCCGDRPDDDLTARPTETMAVDDEDASTVVARAMPRGRTAADMCHACYQIPSSNGTCGCTT